MKFWEKTLVCLLFPLIALCQCLKRFGQFMGRYAMPAMAMLIAAAIGGSTVPMRGATVVVIHSVSVGGAELYFSASGAPAEGLVACYANDGTVTTGSEPSDWNAKLEYSASAGYTLTLNGLDAESTVPDGSTASNGIYFHCKNSSLNLVLIGENTVRGYDSGDNFFSGVCCNQSLTLSGSGTLNAYGEYCGIFANWANLNINGATVNANGGCYGIYTLLDSGSAISVENAVVTAIGTENCGIDAGDGDGTINVLNSTVIAKGGSSALSNSWNLGTECWYQWTSTEGGTMVNSADTVLDDNVYDDCTYLKIMPFTHIGTMTVSAKGYDSEYDGLPHGIAVNVPDGAAVKYGTAEGNYDLTASPTITDVGSLTVYYQVSMDGYETVTGSATVNITKASPQYTAPTGLTATYGDTLGDIALPSGWAWKNPNVSVGNVGQKTFVVVFASGNENYKTVDLDVTVEVKRATLTVKAENKTITYGDAPANNGVTFSGFVKGENEAVLGGILEYDHGYTQYGNVGTYDIMPGGLTSDNYAIEFVAGTLTVEQKEIGINWLGTEHISYKGVKQVPRATAVYLVNGDTCVLTTDVVETTEGAGMIPGRWHARVTSLSNPNYCLPKSGYLVTVDFEIVTGYQKESPDVEGIDTTVKGKSDGKIKGLTTAMEYSTADTMEDGAYTKVTDPNMNFPAGTYYVRFSAYSYYDPSYRTEVTIGEGDSLSVKVPQSQVGYTLTVDKTEFEYLGGFIVTLNIAAGYSKTAQFAVKLNGRDLQWGDVSEKGVQGCITDIEITVEGVADITAPTAEIKVKDNSWTSFLNVVTFGLFFKETQDVIIAAADMGSGVDEIYYYISEAVLSREQAEALSSEKWTRYDEENKPSISPDKKCVVYVKVVDKAQNVKFLSSDGLVFDGSSPAIKGIKNGQTYYGQVVFTVTDLLAGVEKVEIDGVDNTHLEGQYAIRPDNAQHVVAVTDKGGNKIEYKITVYKNYTVAYKIDGKTVSTETVGHGKDATLPEIPQKAGYTAAWDKDGKNISENITVTAVYTKNESTEIENPSTGGNGNVTLWMGLSFVSLSATAFIASKRRKENE